MADDDKLTSSLQESVLTLLCFGGERGQIAAGMLNHKLFEDPYTDIAERAIAYRHKYGEAPGEAHIDDLFDHVLSNPDDKKEPVYRRILMSLFKQSKKLNEEYILTRLTDFARRQKYKSVIYRGAERIQQGGEGIEDDVEQILSEALHFQVETLDGGTTLADKKRALKFLELQNDARDDVLRLDIKPLDMRDINPTRKELLVFIAPRKGGKSMFLTHCAKQALLQGFKFLDISLEMSEERKVQRLFQSLFAIPKRPGEVGLTTFDFDHLGQLAGFDREFIKPKINLRDPKIHRFLMDKMDEWGIALDNLRVKQFPSGQLTYRKLVAYLDFLEYAHNWVPDIIAVDYPALMALPNQDPRFALGRHFVDIRGLCVERNMMGIAPHQSNREGEKAKLVQGHQVAEDISIIATADNVITQSRTKQEKALGLARLFVSNARNDEDSFACLVTQNFATGQFVLDSAPMRNTYYGLLEEYAKSQEDSNEEDADQE